MTEEDVKGLLKEASEKIKDDFIPSMTNLLMDVFQHGLNKGAEIGVKIGSDKTRASIKWQTGEPKYTGSYLVTLRNGKVVHNSYNFRFGTLIKEWFYYNKEIVAWCKLSDIEPYKEETK